MDFDTARFRVEQLLLPQAKPGAVVLEGLHEACLGVEEGGVLIYGFYEMLEVMTEGMGMEVSTAMDWIKDVIAPLRHEGEGFILCQRI
ncbi:MAG: hypothetical protein GY811_05990 [Myxococcales bacterium]|nr:hypothetical protein [Myxococcales bacterium]